MFKFVFLIFITSATLLFVLIIPKVSAIYLTNDTSSKSDKLETNKAIWTEKDSWGALLEEWTLHKDSPREKRVMQFHSSPDTLMITDAEEDEVKQESKIAPGKITHSNNKNKIVNSNNEPLKKPVPGRQVSETDLYLLGAIEKLVYRADFMEKRLRRVEEMLFYVMAGNRIDQEPCPENFTRVASNCYHFSASAGHEFDWKAASKHCQRLGAVLAELETNEENHDMITYIQSNQMLRGKDYWIGGLNPGLLWIWSNSARPIATLQQNNNNKKQAGIGGEGRCLKLAYDPALRSYKYFGSDCSLHFGIICENGQNNAGNQLRRLGRTKKIIDEL